MNDRATFYLATRTTSPSETRPKTRILVVDDDQNIRTLHAAILTREGYEVEVAADGADALKQLAAGRFNLVFSDRHMPVLDGERMVLAMRAAGIRIPVVIISGSVSHRPLGVDAAREVSAILSKPSRVKEIRAAISDALHPSPSSLPASN